MSSADFLRDFILGFGEPSRLIFNTPNLKDMHPYYWIRTDDGYKCTLKTLGINESDINISIDDNSIIINGESAIDGVKYNTLIELPISRQILNDIIEIRSKSINGITVIDLILETPKKKKILINGK